MIECAAVLPDEPDTLRFTEYISNDLPQAEKWESHYFLVEPDGTERELFDRRADLERYRSAYLPANADMMQAVVYRLSSFGPGYFDLSGDPLWRGYGNIGVNLECLSIGVFREGSALKISFVYKVADVWYRMTTVREITALPSEPEISVSLETEPLGDGMSRAHFRAVFHPQEGDGHDYYFGNLEQLYAEHPDAFDAQQTEDGG